MSSTFLKVAAKICLIFVIISSFLLQLDNGELKTLLMYKPTMIHEYWRLITAHFVHLNWSHWLLNVIALILIFWLAYPATDYCITVLLFCSLGVSLGLFYFSPEVDWYVGLSGILHGLLIHTTWHRKFHVLTVLLIAKVSWEQYNGMLTILTDVIVDAHLYGIISGFIIVFLIELTTKNS